MGLHGGGVRETKLFGAQLSEYILIQTFQTIKIDSADAGKEEEQCI